MKRALGELPHDLPAAKAADLVASLSTVAGVEGLIALTDVAGHDSATAKRLLGEIADAILTRYLGSDRAEAFNQAEPRQKRLEARAPQG